MTLNPFAWAARRKAEAAAAARVAAVLTREPVFVAIDPGLMRVAPGTVANLSVVFDSGQTNSAKFTMHRPGTIVGMLVYPDTGEIVRPVYADER